MRDAWRAHMQEHKRHCAHPGVKDMQPGLGVNPPDKRRAPCACRDSSAVHSYRLALEPVGWCFRVRRPAPADARPTQSPARAPGLECRVGGMEWSAREDSALVLGRVSKCDRSDGGKKDAPDCPSLSGYPGSAKHKLGVWQPIRAISGYKADGKCSVVVTLSRSWGRCAVAGPSVFS